MPIYEPRECRKDHEWGWVYFGECDKCGHAQEWGCVMIKDERGEVFWCLTCVYKHYESYGAYDDDSTVTNSIDGWMAVLLTNRYP